MRIKIRQGRVLDPSVNCDKILDILLTDGKVARIAETIPESAADLVLDARGCWVVPGLIDLHVHFRDPGFPGKETVRTGCMAAAAGGFTTVCAMPNTRPVTDCADVVRYVQAEAARMPVANVLVIGAITKGQDGLVLSDMDGMAEAGVRGFSEDGKSVMNAALMRNAMQKAAGLHLPILDHCEDENLAKGCVNEGDTAKSLGLPGIPGLAEELILARDIQIAKETGARLHICHVSTEQSARIIEEAKRAGITVTAEVCPHHFTLDESCIALKDSNYKMNPPLRKKQDVAAVKEALRSGVIDCIATDHAPHQASDKGQDLVRAANGVVGLETAVPLSITELVMSGLMPPLTLVRRMSTNPARVLGIDRGSLRVGAAADVTIIDPQADCTIDADTFYSKGRNTPFQGRRVKGKVVTTILEGRIVYRNGKIQEDRKS